MISRNPLGSIVIAAHNEASVILRCLDALAPLAADGSATIIVVCNGCTDNTAALARGRSGVTVLELSTASKAGALRAGDLAASPGPRIYLDADVVMTSRGALAVFEALARGGVLAARPPVTFDTAGAQWPVRGWYRVRAQLSSIQGALWGAGTYGLSVEGRSRFGEFPDLVSDDLFIDSLFGEDERLIAPTDPVVVRTPRRSSDLLKIMQRKYRTQGDVPMPSTPGAPEPVLFSSAQRAQLAEVRSIVVRHPRQILDVAVYVLMVAIARAQARNAPQTTAWERDESSRV